MSDAPADDQVTRVGPYLVQDVLGSGPHGTVYAVLHEERARPLALKRLHEPVSGRPGDSFNRIARVVVALSHPAIADVSNLVLHGGHVGIIEEVVDGRPLSDVLERDGAIDPTDVLGLARQVCIGLMYAHQRCVYHTSLRPENVFLLPDGSVRITDFAIAALYGNSVRKRPQYTPAQEAYFAPEFLQRGVIHPPSDIFSLGVLLYAALAGGLSGEPEREGDRFSFLEVGAGAQAGRAAATIDPALLPADVPSELRTAITRATSPQAADRPGNVHEFVALIKRTPVRAALGRLARAEVVEGVAPPVTAPGPRVRVCPACRRPVSPAGRVCLACGLVLRQPTEETASCGYFHDHARRLLTKHDLSGAEKAYRRALERDPGAAALHNELGDALAVGNRFDEAVVEYREAVRLDPRDDDAWHDLGVSLMARQRRKEAREALERAAQLTAREEVRLSARIHLGAIAAEEGRVGEAIDTWEGVLRADPGLIPVRMALASAHAAQSDFDAAQEHLRAVLAIDPRMREAENLLARVRERAQLERADTDTSFGLIDDVGGGQTYLGPGFTWVRLR